MCVGAVGCGRILSQAPSDQSTPSFLLCHLQHTQGDHTHNSHAMLPSASPYQPNSTKHSSSLCMQAANVAVSQSNRKINGQLVSSIAATADRPMHHRAGQHAASPPTSSALEAIDMQSQLCNAYARAALGPDHLPPAALQHALMECSAWPGQARSLAPSTLVHKPLLTLALHGISM